MTPYFTPIDETVNAVETYVHALHYQFNDSGVQIGKIKLVLERTAHFIMPVIGNHINLTHDGKQFIGNVSQVILNIQTDTTGPHIGHQAYIVCENSHIT